MAKKEMAEDTKRAIEIMKPICGLLGIDLSADGGMLYIGDQAIGIACNSTYATCMEVIGYLFLEEWPKFRYESVRDASLELSIKRYWISKAALKKLKEAGVI